MAVINPEWASELAKASMEAEILKSFAERPYSDTTEVYSKAFKQIEAKRVELLNQGLWELGLSEIKTSS